MSAAAVVLLVCLVIYIAAPIVDRYLIIRRVMKMLKDR